MLEKVRIGTIQLSGKRTQFKLEPRIEKQKQEDRPKNIFEQDKQTKNNFLDLNQIDQTYREYPSYANKYGYSQHDLKLIRQRPYLLKQVKDNTVKSTNPHSQNGYPKKIQKIVHQQEIKRNKIYNGFTLPTQKCYIKLDLSEKSETQTQFSEQSIGPEQQFHYQPILDPIKNQTRVITENPIPTSIVSHQSPPNSKINYFDKKQKLYF